MSDGRTCAFPPPTLAQVFQHWPARERKLCLPVFRHGSRDRTTCAFQVPSLQICLNSPQNHRMKNIKIKHIALSLIILLLSVINYQSDLFKFLFTGYSATYEVIVVRHSPGLVITLATALIVLIILVPLRNELFLRYLLGVAFILWCLSMRTIVYFGTENTIMSGWSFIKFSETHCSTDPSKDPNCEILFDPLLNEKLANLLQSQ